MLHTRAQPWVCDYGRISMSHVNAGRTGGTYEAGNGFTSPVTQPQIYNSTAPVGSRWTGLLVDSGIARLYHSIAQLTVSGEVRSLHLHVCPS